MKANNFLRRFVCLLLVAGGLSFAQAQGARPASADGAASAPAAAAAIAVADLLSRADSDERLVADITQRIAAADPVDRLTARLVSTQSRNVPLFCKVEMSP